jgi:hypothetical protein
MLTRTSSVIETPRQSIFSAARVSSAIAILPHRSRGLNAAAPCATIPRRDANVAGAEITVKRHPALIPLSHDHRQGLFLAQILKPGVPRYPDVPATPPTKRTFALAHYTTLLQPHMQAEETLLAPLVAGRDAEIDRLLAALHAEHRTLHQHFQALPQVAAADLEAALHTLGQTLEAHIRIEERQLFQRIQAIADETLFAELAERLAIYRRTTACQVSFPSASANG